MGISKQWKNKKEKSRQALSLYVYESRRCANGVMYKKGAVSNSGREVNAVICMVNGNM